jgi:hypothetical protein
VHRRTGSLIDRAFALLRFGLSKHAAWAAGGTGSCYLILNPSMRAHLHVKLDHALLRSQLRQLLVLQLAQLLDVDGAALQRQRDDVSPTVQQSNNQIRPQDPGVRPT